MKRQKINDQYFVTVVPSVHHTGYDARIHSDGIGIVAYENGYATEGDAMRAGVREGQHIAGFGAINGRSPNRTHVRQHPRRTSVGNTVVGAHTRTNRAGSNPNVGEGARARAYAKAMQLPALDKWKAYGGFDGRRSYDLEFEGRKYSITPIAGKRGYRLTVFPGLAHGHAWIDKAGQQYQPISGTNEFARPASAVVAARKFAEREGYHS